MSIPGKFIVVEGLEGAGKTTAIETIKHQLEPIVPNIIVTREPGGTRLGERLRALMKESDEGELIDPRAEMLVMYAARVQLIEHVIRPAIRRGDWVIADRFELSTYAYQGGGRGIKKDFIDSLSAICVQQIKPDLTIYLDIPPEIGLDRVKMRGETDRIEQESLLFFTKVRRCYQEMIYSMDNACHIDASAPVAEVQRSILKQLTHYLQKNVLH